MRSSVDSKKLDDSVCLHPHRTALQNPVTGKIVYIYLPCGMCSACAARKRRIRGLKKVDGVAD